MKRAAKNFGRNSVIGNRDKNEPLIIEVLSRRGLTYKLLPPGFGADILVLDWMEFIEVKNPEQPPSKRRLTDEEKRLQMFCVSMDIGYHVVEQPEDVVRL